MIKTIRPLVQLKTEGVISRESAPEGVERLRAQDSAPSQIMRHAKQSGQGFQKFMRQERARIGRL